MIRVDWLFGEPMVIAGLPTLDQAYADTVGEALGVRVAVKGKLLQVTAGLKEITPVGNGVIVMTTTLEMSWNVSPIQGVP